MIAANAASCYMYSVWSYCARYTESPVTLYGKLIVNSTNCSRQSFMPKQRQVKQASWYGSMANSECELLGRGLRHKKKQVSCLLLFLSFCRSGSHPELAVQQVLGWRLPSCISALVILLRQQRYNDSPFIFADYWRTYSLRNRALSTAECFQRTTSLFLR